MVNSCNCAYAEIALELGADVLEEYVEAYALTDSLTFDGITTAEGYFSLENASEPEIAWSAIGQYHDAVNPCRFMTFMGLIAGGGDAAEPYLVAQVSAGGKVTYNARTETTGRLMTTATAEKLQRIMRNNVESGYGDENFPGLTVCAKSGTAELGDGKESNAMFAGFVLDEAYPLAFFAAVEEGGYGRYTCVPIISRVLEACKEVMDRQ
jgi:peptidoglycan glycosyltransferase